MARKKEEFDFELAGEEIQIEAPAQIQLQTLAQQCQAALDLEKEIEEAEQFVSAKKENLRILLERDIPAAMNAASTGLWRHNTNGTTIELKNYVNGSLPKEEPARGLAFEWLECNHGGDLIKAKIGIEIGRDARRTEEVFDAVKLVKETLDKVGVGYEEKLDVHPQVLYAFVRERLKNGDEVPFEKLGVFAGTTAKIVVPKEPKPRKTKAAA